MRKQCSAYYTCRKKCSTYLLHWNLSCLYIFPFLYKHTFLPTHLYAFVFYLHICILFAHLNFAHTFVLVLHNIIKRHFKNNIFRSSSVKTCRIRIGYRFQRNICMCVSVFFQTKHLTSKITNDKTLRLTQVLQMSFRPFQCQQLCRIMRKPLFCYLFTVCYFSS